MKSKTKLKIAVIATAIAIVQSANAYQTLPSQAVSTPQGRDFAAACITFGNDGNVIADKFLRLNNAGHMSKPEVLDMMDMCEDVLNQSGFDDYSRAWDLAGMIFNRKAEH